ncbi:tRNA pseudouridine(55) synthase TruB [Fervidobacterium pennivorans subsp. shakshaketiis]|uniref:tRNA pseudouridine synthase B n=1 Tax=Fervidobacterium pennivorans (strain DSM 9078 / Ven5) TaxID=771875 RepID=H9UCV1_FERPD|nr:tRNA pseudouridine(55) synthase TruB [Fervidobacterium pennivorans]AFG35344.1 tRNA pseudouridine synthase B [Fervidobacterium pennivorans DSM 9078]QIV78300.1 tRNA pseudouridine(55) synthase TruB [Fervidobacterium pennivorans subsp. keratinolyticus]
MPVVSGILLVDKEKGPTSHDIVERIRKLLQVKQVGHAGTLDPFATGLLVVGVGKATRLLEYLQHADKVYKVKFRLGVITDTFDITGQIMEDHSDDVSKLSEEEVLNTIKSFIGTYKQVPPAYSAKKYQGKKLYELAREGKIINLPPREVTIYDIWDIKINLPEVEFVTKVSSGTYIRSLCMDIGYKLGCGATAIELRRLSVGRFVVDNAIMIPETKNLDAQAFESLRELIIKSLVPLEKVLDFPKIIVNSQEKIYNGVQPKVEDLVEYENFKKDQIIQVFHDGKLIAIARAERNSEFIETLKKHNRNERIATLIKVFKEE